MRETHTAQRILFDFYSKHEFGLHLQALSDLLDSFPQITLLLSKDLIDDTTSEVGRKGLSVESVFRCLILKQKLGISYQKLSFHLSDSPTYRCFARLDKESYPSKSALQSTIRRIHPDTLESVFKTLGGQGFAQGEMDLSKVRIDSTVVKSPIASPSDSQLLNDGIRVLSRNLSRSAAATGIKIRFKDFRKVARSLSARIFYARNPVKQALYIELLAVADKVMDQTRRGVEKIEQSGIPPSAKATKWLTEVGHYESLMTRIISQTRRRVIDQEKVPATEKIVSLFEAHTDIIVKGPREVEYGHKINLASDANGLLTSVMIESGNPSDAERYLPMVESHQTLYGVYPDAVATDGGYASLANLTSARELGIKRVVFHKKRGLTLSAMGVKKKTYEALRNFRAGIEGNISELKRAFGAGKVLWKKLDGFKAYVWSSVICYNLTRLVRLNPG